MKREVLKEPNYVEELVEIIRNGLGKKQSLEPLSDYHDNDIARALEQLSKDERIKVYLILGAEKVSEIFAYMEEPDQYLKELPIEKAAEVISYMDSDDAVDILEEMDDFTQEKLVQLMDDESSRDVKLIRSYSDEEIGSAITTNFIDSNFAHKF